MPASTYIYIAKYPQLENLFISHLINQNPLHKWRAVMTIELSQSFCSFLRNVKEMFSSIFVIINISIAQPASPSKSKDISSDYPGVVSIIILWKHILDLVTRKIILSKYFSVRLPNVQWPEERKESLDSVCTWHFQAYRESLKKFAWRISDKINYGKSL